MIFLLSGNSKSLQPGHHFRRLRQDVETISGGRRLSLKLRDGRSNSLDHFCLKLKGIFLEFFW